MDLSKFSYIKNAKLYAIYLVSLLYLTNCSYSFTGGSVPQEIKTVSVEMLQNNAQIVIPSLAQFVTEELRNKFVSQTKLKLLKNEADWKLSGVITNYDISTASFQANNTAAQNKLTITVSIKFENQVSQGQNWEQNFSAFANFPASVSIDSERSRLEQEVVTRLVQDIFNKVLANW